MYKIILLILSIACGNSNVCAQGNFAPGKRPTSSYDPIQCFEQLERKSTYNIPESELKVDLEKALVKWGKTLEWLGGDVLRVNKMNTYFQPYKSEKWYHVATGFVRGAGVTVGVKWQGKYLVELLNPDFPVVLEIDRIGDEFFAKAHVILSPQ